MLIILLNTSKIYLIPLILEAFLLNHRIPIKKLAILASWQNHWLSIHYFLVNHHVVKLDCHRTLCCETNKYFIAIDHTCHIVNHLFGHRGVSSHWQLLLNNILNWVSKRKLLSQGIVIRSKVGHHKLSSHTTRSTECSHIYLKYCLTRDSIRLTFYQILSHIPCLYYHRRSWLLSHFQLKCFICCEFEVNIVVVQLVDKDTSKLFGHRLTCWDSPAVREDSRSRTVKAEIKFHLCLSRSGVSHHKVKLLIQSFYFSQVESIPNLTCRNSHTIPIKVFCLGTSVIHDVAGLVLLSREFNILL